MEENTELTPVREGAQLIDLEIETAMHEINRLQNIIVRFTEKSTNLKEKDDAIQSRYKQRRDDLHESEKGDFRQRRQTVGTGVELVSQAKIAVTRRIPRAQRFRPVIRCFLQNPFAVEEHDLGEYYLFLTMSGPDRV
jgi:hypothetical protein